MAAYHANLSAKDISPLAESTEKKVLDQISTMQQTARSDWPTFLAVSSPIGTEWIHAFDQHFDSKRVSELIAISDPADFSNDFLVTVCQFGAVLGLAMQQTEPRLQWVAEWPYWESSLYDPATGYIIPPFHWAIKKFSEYGIDDGYTDKIGCLIEALNSQDEQPQP